MPVPFAVGVSQQAISLARAEAVLGGRMIPSKDYPHSCLRAAPQSALAKRRVHALNALEERKIDELEIASDLRVLL